MMRCRSTWILAAILTFAGATGRLQAQQVSDAHIRELIRLAADRVARQPVVSGQVEPALRPAAANDPRPILSLSLDDVVKLALDRNLDIAVQRLNPQINDLSVSAIQATYNPSLTSVASHQDQTQTITSLFQVATSGGAITTGTTTYNAGIAQNLPWGGGNYQVALNNNRLSTDSKYAYYDPQYQSVWSGTYNQPLLQGFRINSTRQQLAVTKINRDVSDVQLRGLIVNTLSNVRNAYWELVYAVQSVEVAKQSLDLANKLVEDNQTKVQIGTLAPIDVVQAQSEAATRRQALVTAESTRRTDELALKKLIVSGREDPTWNAKLDPADRPEFQPAAIDVEAAVRRALGERTDVAIAQKSVASNDVTLKYLRDQLLPQANLQVMYGLQGIGGPVLLPTNGVFGGPTSTIPGGIGDAYTALFGNRYPEWNVQLNFSYPLGHSSQEASVARARVQLTQVQAQMKQIELQVASEVTNDAINVQNTIEAVQAAQAARELAQRKLEAEQSKFEVGMSTNYFVVQAQRDLSDAQNSELRAVLSYRQALVEFERVQQTTLQSLNVTLLNATTPTAAVVPLGTTTATSTTTGGVTLGQ
jgi:outer membrane protein TolC